MSQKTLQDTQNLAAETPLAIQETGIKALAHPIVLAMEDGSTQPTIGQFSISVGLSAEQKGAHFSRFFNLLDTDGCKLSPLQFGHLLQKLTQDQDCTSGSLRVDFPFFIEKKAPVTGLPSLLQYQGAFAGKLSKNNLSLCLEVTVPVTSLCPCSKAISQYGAHNQRAAITITTELNQSVPFEALIAIAEQEASAPLYSLLKREDEKFVTEQAYENPKFAEDLVRDIAKHLNQDDRINQYTVTAENFESIHNHSAFAKLSHDKRPALRSQAIAANSLVFYL